MMRVDNTLTITGEDVEFAKNIRCTNFNMLKVIEPNKDLWKSAVEFAKEIKDAPTDFDTYACKNLIKYIDDNADIYLHFVEKCKHGIEQYVPTQTLWIVDNDKVIGISDLRLKLNDKLMKKGGNLSYEIAPSYRGKNAILNVFPAFCQYIKQHYNLKKILITCDKKNIPSHKVILSLFENFGGRELVPEKISDTETQIRYYINIK